jgi:trehalose 6-phosphate phosphatase
VSQLATPREIVDALLERDHDGPRGLAFDYDGTLVDLQPQPNQARFDEPTRSLLLRLLKLPRTHVVVITGRAEAGLVEVAGDLPRITKVVNGGLRILCDDSEWRAPHADDVRPLVASLAAPMQAAVDRWPGALLERKEFSLTAHFRLRPEAETSLLDEARSLVRRHPGQLHILPGKMSFEIQSNIGWDKGRALTKLFDDSNRRARPRGRSHQRRRRCPRRSGRARDCGAVATARRELHPRGDAAAP